VLLLCSCPRFHSLPPPLLRVLSFKVDLYRSYGSGGHQLQTNHCHNRSRTATTTANSILRPNHSQFSFSNISNAPDAAAASRLLIRWGYGFTETKLTNSAGYCCGIVTITCCRYYYIAYPPVRRPHTAAINIPFDDHFCQSKTSHPTRFPPRQLLLPRLPSIQHIYTSPHISSITGACCLCPRWF
jgi:hypothetical protein